MYHLWTKTKHSVIETTILFVVVLVFAFGLKVAQPNEALAATGINQQLNYQGKLMSSAGAQVSDGNWNFRFRIYSAASGGTVLWTERWTSTTTRVATVNGVFSAALGTIGGFSTSSIDWSQDNLYLQIDMDADNNGSWEESFGTRKRLTSSPYAFNADTVDGFHATSTAAMANYLMALDANKVLNLYDGGVSSTRATTTQFVYIAPSAEAGSVDNLDRSGGDLYVADDIEFDSELFGNIGRLSVLNATTTNIGSLLVYGSATTTGNLTVNGVASSTLGLFTQSDLHVGGAATFDGLLSGSGWTTSWDTRYNATTTLSGFTPGNYLLGSAYYATTTWAGGNNNLNVTGYASSTAGLFTQGNGHYGGNLTVDGNATTTGRIASIGGFYSGSDDVSKGNLKLYGDSGANGGELMLFYGASRDATYQYWAMQPADDASGDTLEFGTNSNERLFLFKADGGLTVTGNATSSGWVNVGTTDVVGLLGSKIGAGDLYVGRNATVTTNLFVGGFASTTNLVLGNDGTNLGTYNDLYVSGSELFFNATQITGSAGLGGSPGAWQATFGGLALTPTSTSAGIYVTASSTIATLRVDSLNATSTTLGTVTGYGLFNLPDLRTATLNATSTTLGTLTGYGLGTFADFRPAVLNASSTTVGTFTAYSGGVLNSLFTATDFRPSVLNASTTNIGTLLGYGLANFTDLRTTNLNASSTANFLNVLVYGSATTTGTLNVNGYASTTNLVLGPNGANMATLDDVYVSGGELFFNATQITGGAGIQGMSGAWQSTFGGLALTPTSTTVGIFVNASSTINANFRVAGDLRVTGNATTSNWFNIGTTDVIGTLGSLIGAGDLYVGRNATITRSLTVDTNTLFVDADNNYVGIGTASPGGKLEVNFTGASGATAFILRTNDGDNPNGTISWQNSAGTNFRRIGSYYNIADQGNLEFLGGTNGNTTQMVIQSGGNVGIGDTSPLSLFTVGDGDKFRIDASGNATSSSWLNIGTTDVIGTLGSKIGAGDLYVGRNATTTGNFYTGSLGLNSEYFTDLTGTGLVNTAGVLTHSSANGYIHIPASGAAAQILQYTSAGTAKWITVSSDITIADGGAVTIAANSVALGTDTINNYLATLADDGTGTITVANSGTESAAVTLKVVDVSCTDCLTATEITDIYVLNTTDGMTGALSVGTSSGGLNVGSSGSAADDNELVVGLADAGAYSLQGVTSYTSDYGVALGGFHVGGTSDPGTDNLIVDGIATTTDLRVYKTGTNDPIASFGSTGATDGQAVKVYNGMGEISLFVAGTDDHFIVGDTTQGDVGIRVSPGDDFLIGTSAGAAFTIGSAGNVFIGADPKVDGYGFQVVTSSANITSYGIYSTTTAANVSYGVYAIADTINAGGLTASYGVYGAGRGNATTKYGVYGLAEGSSINYGLVGSASGGSSNYGLWVAAGISFLSGTLFVNDLTSPGNTTVCRDASGGSYIGACSSLAKYKTDIEDLPLGLNDLLQLQPKTFQWIPEMGGLQDLGFVAEEVEKVNPLLAEYNNGELSGVKYRQMAALIVKSIQQQQQQIDSLSVTALSNKTPNLTVTEASTDTQPLAVIENPDLNLQTLVVRQAATFYGTLYVQGEAGFMHKVVFEEDIEVKGKIYVSADQAGTGIIKAGATSTEIIFTNAYEAAPKVTATAKLPIALGIYEVTARGFRVLVADVPNADLAFDWIALAVRTDGLSASPIIDELVTSLTQASPGIPVELWAQVTDEDTPEADLSYAWQLSPQLGTIDGNSGLVYWTVQDVSNLTEDTDVTITVTVSDGINTAKKSTTVRILKGSVAGASNEDEVSTPPPASPTPVVTPPTEPEPILGCTDQLATNYNTNATQNDSSCTYAEPEPPANPAPVVTPPAEPEPEPLPPANAPEPVDTQATTTQP